MATVDIKLRRVELRNAREQAQQRAIVEMSKLILTNPVVELLGGYWLNTELWRKGYWDNDAWIIINTAITGAVTAQQLAPVLPALSESAVAAIGKLLPTGIAGLLT